MDTKPIGRRRTTGRSFENGGDILLRLGILVSQNYCAYPSPSVDRIGSTDKRPPTSGYTGRSSAVSVRLKRKDTHTLCSVIWVSIPGLSIVAAHPVVPCKYEFMSFSHNGIEKTRMPIINSLIVKRGENIRIADFVIPGFLYID